MPKSKGDNTDFERALEIASEKEGCHTFGMIAQGRAWQVQNSKSTNEIVVFIFSLYCAFHCRSKTVSLLTFALDFSMAATAASQIAH